MPEADTIHYAANRIRPVLEGHVPDAVATPHPRFGHARWVERLAGRAVESVDVHGKHLFLRFEGGLAIHSQLPRMQQSARDGNQTRFRHIYGKGGRTCPRCGPGSPIRERGQWEDNRATFWCPRCQA